MKSQMQTAFLGFCLALLPSCFRASTMPLPSLSCSFDCLVQMKPLETAEFSVKLTQGGESKDQREYTLSVTPEISGLSIKFVKATVYFEGSASLQITTSSNIAPGDYEFIIQASADGVVFYPKRPLSIFVRQ